MSLYHICGKKEIHTPQIKLWSSVGTHTAISVGEDTDIWILTNSDPGICALTCKRDKPEVSFLAS